MTSEALLALQRSAQALSFEHAENSKEALAQKREKTDCRALAVPRVHEHLGRSGRVRPGSLESPASCDHH